MQLAIAACAILSATMNGSRNVDRDAILARRALFVSTALAGLACTSASSVSKPEPDASARVAQGASGPAEGSLETEEAAPAQRPWSELMTGAPPRDIADELPAREREHLKIQVRGLEFEYERLRKIWEGVPDCAANDESCTAWAELLTMLEPLHAESFVGGCEQEANGTTGSVYARRAAHSRFQAQLLAQIEQHLSTVAASHGEASAKAWAAQFSMATGPKPMPCLSACAQPLVMDVLMQVPFAAGSSAIVLESSNPQVKVMLDAVLRTLRGYLPGKLVVRGHADPSEAEPEALAAARAQAVVAWLVEAGADAAKLEPLSLGARLRVEAGEAGLEHNPRVDFELVLDGRGSLPAHN